MKIKPTIVQLPIKNLKKYSEKNKLLVTVIFFVGQKQSAKRPISSPPYGLKSDGYPEEIA